jgi:hypothetical protein
MLLILEPQKLNLNDHFISFNSKSVVHKIDKAIAPQALCKWEQLKLGPRVDR